jgi:hypothetical protein
MPPWEQIIEVLGSTEFLTGVMSGGVAFALGATVARGGGWSEPSPPPLHGTLLTLATLVALQVTGSVPLLLWVACAVLAMGGAAAGRTRHGSSIAGAAMALPGALLVILALDGSGSSWTPWLVVLVIVAGAPLLASFDRRQRNLGLGPLLFTITVAGAYVTLPDTERVLAMLGAALPLTLLGWPRPLASIGPGGGYALVGVYAWVAASGGQLRTAAVIGAIGALGLLLVEPIARWLAGDAPVSAGRRTADTHTLLAFAAFQVIVVALAARLAGTQSTALWAGFVAVASLATATLAMMLWGATPEPTLREPLPVRDQGPS